MQFLRYWEGLMKDLRSEDCLTQSGVVAFKKKVLGRYWGSILNFIDSPSTALFNLMWLAHYIS